MMRAPVKLESDNWSVDEARNIYHISRWGGGYYDINARGHVVAKPLPGDDTAVELSAVIEAAQKKGLSGPLLIRFQDILRHRVQSLCRAFDEAIERFEYGGQYHGVFPLKVNELREVVEEVLDAGKDDAFGLEVGSKSELSAALALQSNPHSLLICNGYKDANFIHTALMGTRLGKRVVLVVEKLDELQNIIEIARSEGVRPQLGIRLRLLSRSTGKWADSGGEDAKFGLDTAQLMTALEILREEGWEDCLQLLHSHIGSQVPDIQTVRKAVQEAARFYAKVRQLGFPVEYLDVGGGLAVDYDGSRAAFDSSANYSLREYTDDIVQTIGELCEVENVPHPNIVSESGRAIVAHHSVLAVQVFAANSKTEGMQFEYGKQEHPLVQGLLETLCHLEQSSKLTAYHNALNCKDEAHNMFTLGVLELETKAKVETLYWEISKKVIEHFRNQEGHVPEEIEILEDQMSDQYICNFSVFQSLLDHWAIDQLFPIMPLQRLNEVPTREATLVDITCDSDGAVRKFIDLEDVRGTLPLHSLEQDGRELSPYYLGIFLVGAYQDVMGDLHNLFGRVNEMHVFLDPDKPSGYYIEQTLHGHSIGDNLTTMQYDRLELAHHMKQQIDRAIKENCLQPEEGARMLQEYEHGLDNYSYLSF